MSNLTWNTQSMAVDIAQLERPHFAPDIKKFPEQKKESNNNGIVQGLKEKIQAKPTSHDALVAIAVSKQPTNETVATDPYRKRAGESDKTFLERLQQLARARAEAKKALREQQLEQDKKDHHDWKRKAMHRGGQVAAGLSVAVPPALDMMGIHSPAAEMALSMAANVFMTHMYDVAGNSVNYAEEWLNHKKLDTVLSNMYHTEGGKQAIISMLARDPSASAEDILTPKTKDEYVPPRSRLLLTALIAEKIDRGIPAAVARLDAIEEFTHLQQRAQEMRDSLGTKVKNIGIHGVNIALGIALGAGVTQLGNSIGDHFEQKWARGGINAIDDLGQVALAMNKGKE